MVEALKGRRPLIQTIETPSIRHAAKLAVERGSSREARIAFVEALLKDAQAHARASLSRPTA